MPTIPFIVTTSEGPKATTVTCSQELYDEVMGGYTNEHMLFEYCVSANYFRDYLKVKGIAFTDSNLAHIVLEEGADGEISIFKDAVNVPVQDVRSILESRGFDYGDFIDSYCIHLKSIKPKIRRPLSGK